MSGKEICGYPTDGNGPCSLPAGDDGTCHLDSHTEPGDVDREPGKTQSLMESLKGNMNGGRHGINVNLKKRLKWIRCRGNGDVELFKEYFREFAAKAENKTQAADLASLAVLRDDMERELLKNTPFYRDKIHDVEELISDGLSPEEARSEAYVNRPKQGTLECLDRLVKEVRLGLKYEGVSGNSDEGGGGKEGLSELWGDGDGGDVDVDVDGDGDGVVGVGEV